MAVQRRLDRRVDGRSQRGEVMLTTLVLLTALMLASTILVSAGERWEARRKAASAAATMARAGAQGEPELIRLGTDEVDPAGAARRVDAVTAALNRDDDDTTYGGRIVAVDGRVVRTEASVTVTYTFPLPGFPSQITGSASAEAVRGIDA